MLATMYSYQTANAKYTNSLKNQQACFQYI